MIPKLYMGTLTITQSGVDKELNEEYLVQAIQDFLTREYGTHQYHVSLQRFR